MRDKDKLTDVNCTISELQERIAVLEAALQTEKQTEQMLRESEALYRSILKASPDAIAITDLEGRIRMVSHSATAMFDLKHENVWLGHPITEFVSPEDREKAHYNIGLMLRGIFTGPGEYLGLRSDGTAFDIEVNADFIRDAEEKPTGMVFIIRNITDRKKTETSHREIEESFHTMVNNAPDGILVHSKGRFLFLNQALAKLVGVQRAEDLIGTEVLAWAAPEYQEAIRERIRFQRETGMIATPMEQEYLRADGTRVYVETTAVAIRFQGQDAHLVFIRDNTLRKQAEQALVQSERNYREIFNGTNEAIFLHDPVTGDILDINETGLKMFGCESKDEIFAVNKNSDLIRSNSPYTKDNAVKLIRMAAEQGPQVFEWLTQRKNGEQFWAEISLRCAEIDGHKRVLAVARDISIRKQAQEALRESEERFRLTFYTSPDSININRLEDGLYIDINEGFTRLTGYNRDDVIGKTSLEINIWNTPEDRMEIVRMMNENSFCENIEKLFRKKDGSLSTGLFSAKTISIRNVPHIISITRDITERKLAEQALRESEAKFRSLIEGAPEAIFVQTEGRISYVNPAACRLWGAESPSLLLGRPILERIHPSMRNSVKEHIRIVNEEQRPTTRIELIHIRFDGSEVPVEVSSMPIAYGDQNSAIVFVRDITERKQAEAERERLMAAIEQVGETVLITSPSGTILYANPAFERVTGYSRTEAIGKTPRILKSGQQDDAFYKTLWMTISSGHTWEGRFINKRRDGKLYTELAVISPVCDPSGTIVNYVAVKRDITQEIETEQQLLHAQKMESVGRLAGGVAHDFNNLLTTIISYTELCRNKVPENHPIRGWLDEITHAGERSADITRQLLGFARKQTIEPKTLDLNDAVTGMLKLLRRMIGEDIELAWVPGKNLWLVKFDPTQIGQVLANLCVNSRDAIANTGKITIETRNVSLDEVYCSDHPGVARGEYVMLVLSDNGCGMEKDVLEHIFDPFFTTKEIGKGTGLGLATVYGIVKQNNGHINVYSEPGEGTTFRVYLPRQFGEAEANSIGKTKALPKGHGETILLVEDEESLRTSCTMLLDMLGYNVVVAENPNSAYETFSKHSEHIDMLLTDIIMPGMNGLQLVQKLNSIKPELKVLYMSGYTADVIDQHGILKQDVYFIEKPFTSNSLAYKIREVLESK